MGLGGCTATRAHRVGAFIREGSSCCDWEGEGVGGLYPSQGQYEPAVSGGWLLLGLEQQLVASACSPESQ